MFPKTSEVLNRTERSARRRKAAHRFVDHLAHQFRTPLTVVKEFSTVLADGLAGEVSPRQQELLGVIHARADDLAILVDNMLDASKADARLLFAWRRPARPTQILDLVRDLLHRKAAVKKVPLEVTVGPDLPELYCDPDQVARIVVNLTANAIKLSEAGEAVRVWIERSTSTAETVIGVTDHGPGMAPLKLQRLLERSAPTAASRGGSKAMGLWIARLLADLNLADVRVETEQGQGSTFSFSLPDHDAQRVWARYVGRLQGSGAAPQAAPPRRARRARTPSGSRAKKDRIQITLLVAQLDGPIQAGLSGLADEFFQQHFGSHALVFRVELDRWVVAIPAGAAEAVQAAERVQAAWSQASRPRLRLPAMRCRGVGTWPLADREAVDLRFRQELAPLRVGMFVPFDLPGTAVAPVPIAT